MKSTFLKISTFLLFFVLIGAGCKKEFKTPSNIILYDKPLSLIQSCVEGKWRLQYSDGGFVYRKIIATHNYYMVLSPDHIILGNDYGVFVDAKVNWELINSSYRFSYGGSYYRTPIKIKNDTLIIRDYLDDGFAYYYTKY